jgi:hypothetical protein
MRTRYMGSMVSFTQLRWLLKTSDRRPVRRAPEREPGPGHRSCSDDQCRNRGPAQPAGPVGESPQRLVGTPGLTVPALVWRLSAKFLLWRRRRCIAIPPSSRHAACLSNLLTCRHRLPVHARDPRAGGDPGLDVRPGLRGDPGPESAHRRHSGLGTNFYNAPKQRI